MTDHADSPTGSTPGPLRPPHDFRGGCWIPAHVLADDSLTADEQIFCGRVYALANEDGYCWRGNPAFAEEFNVTPRTVQRWVAKLADRGHIHRDASGDSGRKGSRQLWPVYPDPGGDTNGVTGGDTDVTGGATEMSPGGDTDVATEKEDSTEDSLRSESKTGAEEAPELQLTPPDENGTGQRERFPPKSRLPREEGSNHIVYPPEFEAAWDAFPERRGSNPKAGAYRKWRARVQDGNDPELLARKAEEFALFVEQEGKDPRYVMRAETFYGPNEPWEQEWLDQPEARSEADRRAAQRFADLLEATREQDRRTTT